jgi:hypothetical protein
LILIYRVDKTLRNAQSADSAIMYIYKKTSFAKGIFWCLIHLERYPRSSISRESGFFFSEFAIISHFLWVQTKNRHFQTFSMEFC